MKAVSSLPVPQDDAGWKLVPVDASTNCGGSCIEKVSRFRNSQESWTTRPVHGASVSFAPTVTPV